MAEPSYNTSLISDKNSIYRKLKSWLNFCKLHRNISPETIVKIEYNERSRPYRIMILGLENLAEASEATLFSENKKNFFGRSYESVPMRVIKTENLNESQLEEPVFIYFHTKIERSENIKIIFEVFVLKFSRKNVVESVNRLGVGQTDVFAEGEKRIKLMQGTPRMYLKASQEKEKILQQVLNINIEQLEALNDCIHLLAESILCGSTEILPGLQDDKLPNAENIKDILLIKTNKIYLRDIKVVVPETLDKQLLQHARQFREYKLESTQDLSDVYINEVRLVIIFHNGWTAVNPRTYQNFAILQKTKKSMLYEYSAEIELDGVFQHEYSSIVLELNYQICIPLQQKKKEYLDILIGWCPIFLNSGCFGQNNIKFTEDFLTGPGKSLSNQMLFDVQLDKEQMLSVVGRLNLSGIQEITRPNNQIDMIGQKMNVDTTVANQLDINTKNKEIQRLRDKYDISIKQLRRKHQEEIDEILEKLRRGGTTRSGNFEDTEIYYKELIQKKDEELRQQLEELTEEFKTKEQEKDQQIEMLKDMARGIQSQHGVSQQQSPLLYSQRLQTPGLMTLYQNTYQSGQFSNLSMQQGDNNMIYDINDIQSMNYNQMYRPRTGDSVVTDKAYLLQSGIKGGLLDDINEADTQGHLEQKKINIEIDDPQKANTVYVQLLAIKPFAGTVFSSSVKAMQDGETQSRASDITLPERMYMTFNFFDFPPHKTDVLCFENRFNNDQQFLEKNPQAGVPLVLAREIALKNGFEDKEALYKYDIDPEERNQPHVYIKLAKYLYSKALTVDIWDADSLMLFGSVKVTLRNLLRQGKKQAVFTKEYEIFDKEFQQIKGTILIFLKNQGRPSNYKYKNINQNDKGIIELRENESGQLKKKVKLSTSLKVPESFSFSQDIAQNTQQSDKLHNTMTSDQRKHNKVSRYKKFVSSVNNPGQVIQASTGIEKTENSQKAKMLRDVENYRELKKNDILRNTIASSLQQEKSINVSFGQSVIIPFQFNNPFDREQSFSIVIEDPDQKFLSKPELTVISNPAEWRFWIDKNEHFERPPSFNIIAENVFLLEPQEKLTLLFKFLSLRDIVSNQQEKYIEQENQEPIANQTLESKNINQRILTARNINVYINELKGKTIGGMNLKVNPYAQIIDHTFRFFEQENRQVTLTFPTLYQHSVPPSIRLVILQTYSKAIIEWVNEREIQVQLKTLNAPKVMRFGLLAYGDCYNYELLGNWQLEIYCFTGVDINLNMGQLTTIKLSLPGDITRYVQCYSSNPSLAYFPTPFDSPFTLQPGSINIINTNLRSFNPKTQTVQINCVDINTKELIYSWILRLSTTSPEISKIFPVATKVGEDQILKFNYSNKTNSWSIFQFVSSHPNLLEILDPRVPIGAGTKEGVRVKIKAAERKGAAEIQIFANDQEERIFDCLLFRITYQ